MKGFNQNLNPIFVPAKFNAKDELELSDSEYGNSDYVFLITMLNGLATPSAEANWGKLTATTYLEIRGFQKSTKATLFQEALDGIGPVRADIEKAISDTDQFAEDFSIAADTAAYKLIWRMAGRNYLYLLAKDTPLAKEFPSIQSYLADMEDSFKYKPIKFKKWRRVKTGIAYKFITEPKKDAKNFGIVTEVDLLAKELGQDFDNINDYVSMYMGRLATQGLGY